VYKKFYASQPEDGFVKIAETCHCYDCLIIFYLCLHKKVVSYCTIVYILLIIESNRNASPANHSVCVLTSVHGMMLWSYHISPNSHVVLLLFQSLLVGSP